MTGQLPEVGSVWRDVETGMVRVIHSHSEDGQHVYFYKPGIDRRCNATADEWGYMQTFFARLDAAPPPLTLEEAEYILRIVRSEAKEPEEQAAVDTIWRDAVRKHDYDYRKSLAHWLRDYINGRGKQ